MVQLQLEILEVKTSQERETGNVKELGETSRWQRPRQINRLPEKRVSSCPCQVAAGEKGDAPRGKVEEAENMSQQGGWQAGQPCHDLTTPATAAQRWRGGRDSSLFCGRDARAGAQPTSPGLEPIRAQVCSMAARWHSQWRRRQRRPLARVQRAGAGKRERSENVDWEKDVTAKSQRQRAAK